MCRFARRCDNFYPDTNNPSNCLLICQKNPLALSIALMPDRYIEKQIKMAEEDQEKKINLTQELPVRKTRAEQLQKDYEELVSVTQDLENEVVEYKPDFDMKTKLKAKSNDIAGLIKKTNIKRNATIIDEEMSQAIKDSFTDHETIELHPLDEIDFTPIERIGIANEPEKPNNPEIYIKTRERGRPKMSDEEKETARVQREEEKTIRNKEKDDEAIEKRKAMKKRVAKKKKKKKK